MTELSEHLEDTTEANSEDVAQLRRDMRNHPRTSGRSMRELARVCSTAGSPFVRASLDYAYEWLAEHRHLLPSEIEDDHGNRGSVARLEITVFEYDDLADATAEANPDNGLYDVGQAWRDCYKSLDETSKRSKAVRELYLTHGMVAPMYCFLMDIRGELFEEYAEAAYLRRLKRNNPQEYGRRAAEALKLEGIGRTPVKRNAKYVPDDLVESLEYTHGILRWAVARGRVAKGTRVEGDSFMYKGRRYKTHLVVERIVSGVQPSRMVYRDTLKVTIVERDDGLFDVMVKLEGRARTLAECRTYEQAELVRAGARWEFNQGLTSATNP